MNVDLTFSRGVSEYCYNLTIGDRVSDQIIGNALGKMTEFVASKYFQYNSSRWCYVRKTEEREDELLWTLYQSFVRLTPDLENMCCQFKHKPLWRGMHEASQLRSCLVGYTHRPGCFHVTVFPPSVSKTVWRAAREN